MSKDCGSVEKTSKSCALEVYGKDFGVRGWACTLVGYSRDKGGCCIDGFGTKLGAGIVAAVNFWVSPLKKKTFKKHCFFVYFRDFSWSPLKIFVWDGHHR